MNQSQQTNRIEDQVALSEHVKISDNLTQPFWSKLFHRIFPLVGTGNEAHCPPTFQIMPPCG